MTRNEEAAVGAAAPPKPIGAAAKRAPSCISMTGSRTGHAQRSLTNGGSRMTVFAPLFWPSLFLLAYCAVQVLRDATRGDS